MNNENESRLLMKCPSHSPGVGLSYAAILNWCRKEAHWNWKSSNLAIHEGVASRLGPSGKDLQLDLNSVVRRVPEEHMLAVVQ